MIPPKMDRERFSERKRLGAEYLARMARASAAERTDLLVEWAEKLYDAHAERRMDLLKSLDDFSLFRADLGLYYSGTIMPLLADVGPADFESEAIRLAIAGRDSY